MRISTRSWPDCDWTSDAYLAACCGAAMWSILILMPVSLVKRTAISSSFLSMSGAKLFQQRYEISRCCPRAGGIPAAKMPARPAPVVVVRKRRRVIDAMNPPLSFTARAPRAGAGAVVFDRGNRSREPLLEHDVERRDQDQREERRDHQAADHRDGERLVRLGPDAEGERHGQETDHRGQRGHEDRPEPDPSRARHRDGERLAVAAPLVDVLDWLFCVSIWLRAAESCASAATSAARDASALVRELSRSMAAIRPRLWRASGRSAFRVSLSATARARTTFASWLA